MTCSEFEARLQLYVDGELPLVETGAADAHAAECSRCAGRVHGERGFRRLLRRQPREAAPPELRARIVDHVRRAERRAVLRPWLVAPALAAIAAILAVVLLLPALRETPSLVGELVDKHIAYAQVERPAELASTNPAEIEEWFRQRAGLSPAGIRLVGARLTEARERKAAYLFYEKGRTLLSVFIVPASATDAIGPGARITFRGHEYTTREVKGYRAVSWTDGRVSFGLVSMLDYDALFECADRLRAQREHQTSL